MYFQLLSPDERKHWGCKILLDCLSDQTFECNQRKLISNHCRIKLDPIHKVNVCTIFYTISKFECWRNCWRPMQLLCCKQQQSSLRIRPRSKNTDPQSVRDVSLNVATPLMVRGRNGRHSDGGYRSRHTDDDLSGDRGRVFVGGCLCWWGKMLEAQWLSSLSDRIIWG